MCGIVGFLDLTQKNIDHNIDSMIDAINHRGPDDFGSVIFNTYHKTIDKQGNLSLGHKRLSILDLSQQGHQPMISNDKNLIITYNGEIFNFKEIRKKLQNIGYKFNSQTDTEVILYAYQEYGKKCLDLFRGFFAFCIYDIQKNILFLARDRLGAKPLKYYFNGEIFAFASELKSLMVNESIKKKLDFQAIEQFLTFKYIPAPQTIFCNTFKLEAGHYLEFDIKNKNIKITNYWEPKTNNFKTNNIVNTTEKLLEEAINIRTISDVPIGIFLSGGIDSSVITALLRKNFEGEINAFSMGFNVEKFDERKYAKQVADKFETNHKEFIIDLNFKHDLNDIINSYDEPFADPSIIPSYYLAKETSKYAKVILGGDGGDEIFGGYKRYKIQQQNAFLNYFPKLFLNLDNKILSQTPCGIYKKQGWGKVNRLLEYFSYSFTDNYYLRVSNFTKKEVSCLMELSQDDIWSKHIHNNVSKYNRDNLNKIMAIDSLTHLPEYILHKSDIAGMSNSIEIRAPLIDHKLVEFVNNLPSKYKNNKNLLKEIALKNGVPKNVIYRKKMGFTPPLRNWTLEIQDEIKEVLFESKLLSFLNKKQLEKIYNFHYQNDRILASKIWGLYVLGTWLENNKKYIHSD